MRIFRGAWSLAGVIAGIGGLATSYFVATMMMIRESPVVAVSELVVRWIPGPVAERAIAILGSLNKPFLVIVILLLLGSLFAYAGRLARRSRWASVLVLALLAAVGAGAVLAQRATTLGDLLPVAVGFVTWLVCLALLAQPLRRAEGARAEGEGAEGEQAEGDDEQDEAEQSGTDAAAPLPTSRRSFVLRAGLVTGFALLTGVLGRVVGRGRAEVEESRRLLRLSGVSEPQVPSTVRIGVEGVTPWMTPADEFYRIHTAILLPVIEPVDWELRIHGMVEREVVVTYEQLLARRISESWITLNCVSNPIGGTLIGNAWWSGVRVADLLAEAGVLPGADAVRQTSEDGWTCGTPLEALTDDRDAMLAIAMNGKPLPIDHGFPVRTIVPGLYGYVSATKWVVDMEVTRFADFEAYWTTKGWGEQGPVKLSSRVDVPRPGDEVEAGGLRVGGVAWAQHTGIASVEYAVDGGDWQPAEIASPPTDDTWVQWAGTLDVEPGDHVVRVRATDKDGLVQTGVERDVLPDGATGWHTVGFQAA